MSQRQETEIDRLLTVIQQIQLGRRTGLLLAKRGVGVTREEGTIVFVNGQMTEAKVDRRSGSDAFNWLSTWRNCLYTFTSPVTQPIVTASETRPLSMSSSRAITAPYRTQQLEVALRVLEKKGFSRTHRHILLLIDGQRSIEDLVRLMGRRQNEVLVLLQDLARATIIQLPEKPT